VISVEMPEPFFAIGGWYADFTPTSEQEVVDLLAAGGSGRPSSDGPPGPPLA
jgi:predicted phosphoribosyltransferase